MTAFSFFLECRLQENLLFRLKVHRFFPLILFLGYFCFTYSQSINTTDFQTIIKKAKDKVFPAVVFIKCVQQSHETGEKQAREVTASGVLISPGGELLTNWHVIDKAIQVRCLLFSGQAYEAEVVGRDKELDIALIRLKLPAKTNSLPYAELGDSKALKEGDFVMAMGAPWGLARSVSIGIVSCTRRYLEFNSAYSLWLQTDASISPGNSGGPLVNTDGHVVGINTMGVFFGGDMGFAVPSSTIKEILPRLREYGDVKWAWTGMELQPLRDFDRDVYFDGTEGVIVASTEEGSPARRAAIKDLDRILSIDGRKTTALTIEDLPEIRRMIGLLNVNKTVKVTLLRNGKNLTVDLTPRYKGKVEGEELDCPRWDMTVKAINQFDNPDLYFYRKTGIFIYGIKYPGNAALSQLRRRDIILEIDGKEVNSLDDIRRIWKESIDSVSVKPTVSFTILRNGIKLEKILDFSRDFKRE